MRIASWNVFNRTKDTARILGAVEAFDADVVAFQELLDPMATALDALPDTSFSQADDFDEKNERTRLGILSRLPTSNHHIIDHNPGRRVSPSLLGRLQGWRECIQSHSVEIAAPMGPVTLVNLHLSCGVSIAARAAEFEAAIAPYSDRERLIVTGDFNSFGTPSLNMTVGWAAGVGLSEMLTNERAALFARAALHGLKPALPKAVTFPARKLHLDHIFVRGLTVLEASVAPDLMGSDHLPILSTLA